MLASAKTSEAAGYAPQRRPVIRQSLKVQPVLTYEIPQRREATSWRSWGGIQTEEQALTEKIWISSELKKLKQQADFPLEFLPVALVKNDQQAASAAKSDFDVMLIYGAGGGGNLLETLTVPGKANLMFLRHSPGPAYLWYEIVSPRFLRKTVDEYGQPGWTPQDVVVDEHAEILWRLRALSGLKNTLGKRMVCIGGAAGWGQGGQTAPAIARELWKMDLVDYPYKELATRITAARANAALVNDCKDQGGRFPQRVRHFPAHHTPVRRKRLRSNGGVQGCDGRTEDRCHDHQFLHGHHHAHV